jgi:hypothetical protein
MSYSVTAIGAAPNSIGAAQLIDASITPAKFNPNRVSGTPANPAATASAVLVMAGLAIAFTPSSSGRVRVIITGKISNDTGGDGAEVQIAHGTGAAPVNGAAAAGVLIGNAAGPLISSANDQSNDIALVAVLTGLAIGTARWFDLQFEAVTGGNATIRDLSYVIEEF